MDQQKQPAKHARDAKPEPKPSRIYSHLRQLQVAQVAMLNTPPGTAMELPEMCLEDPERWDGMS